MGKASRYFLVEELVSPQIYGSYGDFSVTAIDNRLLNLLDIMRDYFGKITINDWVWNDNTLTNYRYSGLRTMMDEFYKSMSQHSFGRSSDIKSDKLPTIQLYKIILEQKEYFMKHGLTGLERIEDTPNWIHVTVGNYPEAQGRLAIIPKEGVIEYV